MLNAIIADYEKLSKMPDLGKKKMYFLKMITDNFHALLNFVDFRLEQESPVR